tara:strand:- start:63 stop:257 length:195 start_codon:yes stop_codon:yes gene_type:complete
MVKKGGSKMVGGGLLVLLNKSVKSVNKSLKDPENLLIALLTLVLLALILYYVKLCFDDKMEESL